MIGPVSEMKQLRRHVAQPAVKPCDRNEDANREDCTRQCVEIARPFALPRGERIGVAARCIDEEQRDGTGKQGGGGQQH